jgi:hypothetical protein
MTPQEIEELFIRSLDTFLTAKEQETLIHQLEKNPPLAKQLYGHRKIRESLKRKSPASFGYHFAEKLTARIENTGVIIERQIFTFFKKYQLLAAGVIVGLLVLNTLFSERVTIDATFGLDQSTSTETTPSDQIISFDFYKTLNTDL